MIKTCNFCGKEFSGKGIKWCSSICKDRFRNIKSNNRSKRYEKRRLKLQAIRDFKLSVGCEICGYNEHPAALQFDHISPEDKRYSPGRLHTYSQEVIDNELMKCRVLCANCHSIHTFNQSQEKISKKELEDALIS